MSLLAKLATAAIILTAIWCYSQANAATTHQPVSHTTVHHPAAKKTRK